MAMALVSKSLAPIYLLPQSHAFWGPEIDRLTCSVNLKSLSK